MILKKIEKCIEEFKKSWISYQTKIYYCNIIIWEISKLKWVYQTEKWPCDLCIDLEKNKSLNNYCWNCWRKIF